MRNGEKSKWTSPSATMAGGATVRIPRVNDGHRKSARARAVRRADFLAPPRSKIVHRIKCRYHQVRIREGIVSISHFGRRMHRPHRHKVEEERRANALQRRWGGGATQGPQSLRHLVSSLNEKEVLVVAMTSSSSSMTFCFHVQHCSISPSVICGKWDQMESSLLWLWRIMHPWWR
jgi:hypothetical protein